MAAITYLNFDLLIEGSKAGYRAQVLECPAGQATCDFTLPFLELEDFLLCVGRPRQGVRHWGSSPMKAARDFGGRLFEAVFDGEVQTCLRRSLDEIHRLGAGLRIRLRLAHDVPELADVPWEYLHDPSFNRFLVLSIKTPLVRYLHLPEPIRPLAVEPPLRVLVMISNPRGYSPLDVDREWASLQGTLSTLEQRGLVTLERLEAATLSALQQWRRPEGYHIFHFIGHGGFDELAQNGVLIMEDEQGRSSQVSGQRLGTLLHDRIPPLQLAILNACEGGRASPRDPFAGIAQSLVQQGIPAVIAMQLEITDKAAITLAHEFYSALADGYPVDAALTEARRAIFAQENDVEWGMPVLYMRSPDGQLFDIEPVRGMEPLAERKKDIQGQLAKDRERLKEWEDKLQRASVSEEQASFKEMIRVLCEDIEMSTQKIAAIEEELWQSNVARLDRLYAEAEQAESISDWTKAISIFQQILDIDRDYKDAPQRLTQAKKQERLERLYAEVERAEANQDWAQVIHLCQQILDVDRGYKDASRKLAQATVYMCSPDRRIFDIERVNAKEQQDHQHRRIDAAAPSHANVGQSIDLLVQVRFPDSPLLGIEDWPAKRKPPSIEQVSEPVTLEFPAGRQTGKMGSARLEIRVVAPDFAVEGAAQRIMEVPPDRYSKRVSFLLTAKKAGRCRINVEVYSVVDHIYLGTIPVEIEAIVSGRATAPTLQVANLFLVVAVEREALSNEAMAEQEARKIAERSSQPDPAGSMPLRTAVLGSVLGFLVGVLGNLVAGWIQQDLLGSAFTLPWIVVILLLTAAGLGAGVWIQRPQRLDRKLKAVIVAAFGLAVLIAVVSSLTMGIDTGGKNHPPDIQSISASPSILPVGQKATLTVIAADVDGDNLVYYWEARKGTVPPGAQGDTIIYTAPASSGLDTIRVTVTDGVATVNQEIKLSVLAADASGQ